MVKILENWKIFDLEVIENFKHKVNNWYAIFMPSGKPLTTFAKLSYGKRDFVISSKQPKLRKGTMTNRHFNDTLFKIQKRKKAIPLYNIKTTNLKARRKEVKEVRSS